MQGLQLPLELLDVFRLRMSQLRDPRASGSADDGPAKRRGVPRAAMGENVGQRGRDDDATVEP